jgi:hypothetical protein
MSDANERQPPDPRARYQFTDEEIVKYLAEKWKIEQCEVCHETPTWVYLRPRPLSLIPASDGSSHAIGPALTAFLRLFCSNCGNTKFLAAEVIRQWLDANA